MQYLYVCVYILHFQIDFISAINSSKLVSVDSGTVCSLSELVAYVGVEIVYAYRTPEVETDVFSSGCPFCSSTREIPIKKNNI